MMDRQTTKRERLKVRTGCKTLYLVHHEPQMTLKIMKLQYALVLRWLTQYMLTSLYLLNYYLNPLLKIEYCLSVMQTSCGITNGEAVALINCVCPTVIK